MNYFMGIDLGTSSTKTLIMDENGKTAGIGNASYGIQIPQISYAEQDPLEWWEAVKKSIQKALQEAGLQGRDIAGIGFSGQMHGMGHWMRTNSWHVMQSSILIREAV